jgi:hypothetical protein
MAPCAWQESKLRNVPEPAPKFIDNAPAPTVAQALANNAKQVDQAK